MSEIIKLHPMQWRFVQEYIKDLNATQSAIRAGYARGSAKVTGSRLLSNANVKAALAQEQRKAAERVHVDQDRVLREYARIAFADIRQIVQWDDTTVTLRKSSEVPPALGWLGRGRILPCRLLAGGFALDTVLYGAAWFGVLHLTGLARRRRQRRRGCCPDCGYDLAHAAHECCPECGRMEK